MRERLDKVIKQRRLIRSRTRAQRMIAAGRVRVNGQIIVRAGHPIDPEAKIEIVSREPYVSRGGEKLAAALTFFRVDPRGAICLDIGSGTGGFSDCLLQHGATRVHSLDVGREQLDPRLRRDHRVIVHERVNARYLTRQEIGEPIELCTIDVSFISLRYILPPLEEIMTQEGTIIALVKPQFEAGRELVGKTGVIRDPAAHLQVLTDLAAFTAQRTSWAVINATFSPLRGQAGNIEFVFHLSRQRPGQQGESNQELVQLVARAHSVIGDEQKLLSADKK